MTFPVFASGDVLNASDMNAVGLWLVKTQTIGSGVSSIAVTGAFSSDYENYKIIVYGGTGSGANLLRLQLGSTTTGYYSGGIDRAYTNTNVSGNNANNAASWPVGTYDTDLGYASIELFGPNLAKQTTFYSFSAVTGTADSSYFFNGYENSTTQHTAFTLIVASGTMTGGTIRVYGYRN